MPEVAAALAGAAIVRWFDVGEAAARERQRRDDEEKRQKEQQRRDLDETRRVAYIARYRHLAGKGGGPELLATLVNSLAHHSRLAQPYEAAYLVARVLDPDNHSREERATAEEWLDRQISDIESKLRELDGDT